MDEVDELLDRVASALDSPTVARPAPSLQPGAHETDGRGTPAGMVDVGRRGFLGLFRRS